MTSVDLGWLEIERARYELLLDPLTALPRWTLLIDRVSVALARSRRIEKQVAVFAIDDPHIQGAPRDIKRVAAMLKARIRPDDTLARIGDRRFAVVCNDIGADEDAAHVARRLIYDSGVICGLGVALGDANDTPELLIGRALLEMIRTSPTS
jgi:GGDEF domain-containing protein